MNKKYRLINNGNKLGIYRFGGGYIVDPSNTLLFNDEVQTIYTQLIKGEKSNASFKKNDNR